MLKSVLSLYAALVLLLLSLIICIAIVQIYSSVGKVELLSKAKVLVIDLSVRLRDAPSDGVNTAMLVSSLEGSDLNTLYLLNTIQTIEKAAEDPKIKGIYLHGSVLTDQYGSSYAALRELRDALIRFKESGKTVYALLKLATMRDYFVASVADKLFIHPQGGLDMSGFSAEMTFLGDAFKKYGVGIQVVRSGAYKSATEVYTRSNMSPENRTQVKSLLDSRWNAYVQTIASSRQIEPEKLEALVDKIALFTPQEAVDEGFFDEIAYYDQVKAILGELAGYDEDTKDFNQISLRYYDHLLKTLEGVIDPSEIKKKTIAVIYAEGAIVDGQGGVDLVGSERLSKKIAEYKREPNIEAVVLRVNSPGGGVLASEEIQRQVRLCAKAKPLYVSFGAYAASGGYWISAYADKIYANPETITGSIGVFGMVPNFKKLGNDFGVTWDGVSTAQYADALKSVSRPKTEAELAIFEKFIDSAYDDFLTKVSEGRRLSLEQVESIAQGRVWSGQQAMEHRLVDEIGGLRDTIAAIAKDAALGNDYHIVEYPREKAFIEQLNELMGGQQVSENQTMVSGRHPVGKFLGKLESHLNAFNDSKGVYARLPWLLEFK